jgi:hypothetical protein
VDCSVGHNAQGCSSLVAVEEPATTVAANALLVRLTFRGQAGQTSSSVSLFSLVT